MKTTGLLFTLVKKLFGTLILLFGFYSFAFTQDVNNSLTPAQLKEDFTLLRYHLENVSPGLYTYTPKATMDSIFDSIYSELSISMSSADFFKSLLCLNKPIANNHTGIEPSEEYTDFLKTAALRFPFTMFYKRDSLFIFADNSDEFSIGHGKLVKSINGVPALEIIEYLADHVYTDGYNRTMPLFVAAYRFSRYYAYLYGLPEKFVIEYWGKKQQLQKTAIKAITVEQIRKNAKTRITHQALLYDTPYDLSFKDDLAILRIRNFQPQGEWSEGKFKRFLKASFTEIKAKGTKKLLIDIRKNGGGFPESAMALLSYLIDQPVRPYKEEYAIVKEIPQLQYYQKSFFIKHFRRLGKKKVGNRYTINSGVKMKVNPKSPRFEGELYILMNELCASAATEFIGQVKTHTDAFFIGREPGGNSVTQTANDLPVLILPNSKIRVTIPLVKATMNVNWENDGYGVQPDLEMEPTVDELLHKRDDLLQKTIHLIQSDKLKRD